MFEVRRGGTRGVDTNQNQNITLHTLCPDTKKNILDEIKSSKRNKINIIHFGLNLYYTIIIN